MSFISLDCSRPLLHITIFLLLNYEANLPWKFNTDDLKSTTDNTKRFTNLSKTKTNINVVSNKCSIKSCWYVMKES